MNKTVCTSLPKRTLKLTLLGIGLIVALPVTAQDDTTGLILHYSFENVSGSLIGDDSGNNNTGTLRGGAALAEGVISLRSDHFF